MHLRLEKYFHHLYNKDYRICVNTIEHLNNNQPMKYFTPEEIQPSERTLNIIRQVAYSYRPVDKDGQLQSIFVN